MNKTAIEEELNVQPIKPGKSFTVVFSKQDHKLINSLNESLGRGFRASRLREWGYAFIKLQEKYGNHWQTELNGTNSIKEEVAAWGRRIIARLDEGGFRLVDNQGREASMKDVLSTDLEF